MSDDLDMKKLRQAYYLHSYGCKYKRDAMGNPVEMRLTFEEWLQIWIDSGKLHLRGKKKGCYVMSRQGDLGHYELGNVFIQTTENNIKDANLNKCKSMTDEIRAKMSAAQKGKRRGHLNNRSRSCTIDGIKIYSTLKEFEEIYGRGKKGTRSPNFRFLPKKD